MPFINEPLRGKKFDDGKDRWDLVPWKGLRDVVRVISYGANKYGDDNWRQVPNGRNRYSAAAMRHFTAWRLGEDVDPESGLPHLAHACCSLLFLLANPWNKRT